MTTIWQDTNNTQNSSAMVAAPSSVADPSRFAYSRASNHATADLIKLNQAKAYTDRAKLMVGNGDKSQITNVSISFLPAIKDKYLVLNGFLHVPLLQ